MVSIRESVNLVGEFHQQIGAHVSLLSECPDSGEYLRRAGEHLITESKRLLNVYKTSKDSRYLRCHLLVEELGETMVALSHKDEVEALDGLADLQYVLFGTAHSFDWPLEAAFLEVHRSNMTKRPQSSDPDACRVRVKGDGFVAPDLERVLRESRGS